MGKFFENRLYLKRLTKSGIKIIESEIDKKVDKVFNKEIRIERKKFIKNP